VGEEEEKKKRRVSVPLERKVIASLLAKGKKKGGRAAQKSTKPREKRGKGKHALHIAREPEGKGIP